MSAVAPVLGLADVGIVLRRPWVGWQGAPCPECARTKLRRGDDALGVQVFADGGARWSCQRCGWKGLVPAPHTSGRTAIHQRVRALVAPEPDRVAFGREHAAYWERLDPIAAASAVGRYLLGRGCPLPPDGADLRLDPRRRHPHQRDWVGPAMVARITDAITAAPLSFHVTWVSLDGAGKAPLERPRLIARGTTKRGGVVRLCDDADVGVGLAIAEGIETALSATLGFGPAVWACLDAGNITTFPVLAGIDALTVIADHDHPDRNGRRAGQAAAEACAARWHDADREVRICLPAEEGRDFNDLVQGAVQ